MKYLLLAILIFSFQGCEDRISDEDEVTTTVESDDTSDTHLDYGGDGSLSSPYNAGNGSYGLVDSDDTYFDITLNGSCNVLLYDINILSSFLLFNSDYTSYDITTNTSIFKLYSSVSSGTYNIRNNTSLDDIDDARLGIYGTCISDVYDYEVPTLATGLNTFSVRNQLYTFTLDSDILVTMSEVSEIDNFYIFDENLDLLHYGSDGLFSETLELGTYYLLVAGDSSDSDTDTTIDSSTFNFSK